MSLRMRADVGVGRGLDAWSLATVGIGKLSRPLHIISRLSVCHFRWLGFVQIFNCSLYMQILELISGLLIKLVFKSDFFPLIPFNWQVSQAIIKSQYVILGISLCIIVSQ